MEMVEAIALAFVVLVLGALLTEAARRLARSLLDVIAKVAGWMMRAVYWLLVGWWFGMLRRWVTGSVW